MKQFISLIVLVILTTASFAQQVVQKQPSMGKDYLKKANRQKTAAWILTGAGTAGLIVTLAADASQSTTGVLTTVFSLGTVEPEYKSYTVPYIISAASVLSGIYLFVASSKNKRKAKAATVFINTEKIPVLQQAMIRNQSYPALGLKVRF